MGHATAMLPVKKKGHRWSAAAPVLPAVVRNLSKEVRGVRNQNAPALAGYQTTIGSPDSIDIPLFIFGMTKIGNSRTEAPCATVLGLVNN